MAAGGAEGPRGRVVRVQLLGPFTVCLGARNAGPWPRPTARRLCELVFVSPGRRLSRDQACEALFPGHAPAEAARALVKALSMARAVLGGLGEAAGCLLGADRTNIWVVPGAPLEVDAERHEKALRAALAMTPGRERDDRFVAALAEDGTLLADEPYADWAIAPRERLGALRQQARLALAHDRAKGAGQARPDAVVEAWESCLAHDPASEEAAAALARAYGSQGLRHLAVRAYERCQAALEELGLRPSPALEEVHAAAVFEPTWAKTHGPPEPGAGLAGPREERRVVSVLFAEVLAATMALKEDPEDLRDLLGAALARVITAVEGLGGTVTSVSGAGLQALFGAPETHEDDPERAVRAAFRSLSADGAAAVPAPLRIGVETGPAIVGPVEAGASSYYRVVGAVVGAAAALQSVARPGSVLVGPATRAATEGLFEWNSTEDVLVAQDANPLVGAYLEQPRPRAPSRQLRLGGRGPLVGRAGELSSIAGALQETEAGTGSVVVLVGEPGLGKTRLVQECRKRFMAWVGARSGRLPLWAEGGCASYASTSPYGLYRHLLAGWVGVAPDQPEAVVAPALERALVAVMGDKELWPLLARMMDLSAGAALARMHASDLQRATFAAVRRVVARLASAGPTVLALEDLHWADATSLRLTEELAPLALEGPLLMLLTRRPHPDPGVSALEATLASVLGPKLRRIELSPLSSDTERELATALVGEDDNSGAVDAIRAGTEGNPLFLEERLFSMVESGALVGEPGHWRLAEGATPDVPQALERMVRSRVDHLSPGAQEVVRTASVIGPEPGLTLLEAACDAGEQLAAHLAELAGAGLLGELANAPEPTYRFRHALVQEATYRSMLRAERRCLHGRVAWALESLSEGRLPEVAAVLGRHFANAGEPERAVHYYEAAADGAVATYANEEAIASLRSALDIVEADRSANAVLAEAASGLWEKLALVTSLTGRRNDARQAYRKAINLLGSGDMLRRAQLHAGLGWEETQDRCFDVALVEFEAAKELLGDDPGGRDQATADIWIGMMNAWMELYRSMSEPELELALLQELRPVVAARGSVEDKIAVAETIPRVRAALARYRFSAEDIAEMRRAAQAHHEPPEGPGTGWSPMLLGYFAFLHGDLDLSREQLERSLAMAEKYGNAQLRAASMVILPLTALRRHDTEAVRQLGPEAVAACEGIGFPEWVAMAKGSLAWLAWQDGRPDDVLALAAECDELMKAPHGPEIFVNWVRLWPVVATHLAANRTTEAVAAGRQMLDPSQQRFEDELESLLQSACQAWDAGDPGTARLAMGRALGLAGELRYF
jgi:class 3 adenylate cyclase